MKTPPIAIVMGSESDLRIMKEAQKALKLFGINYHTEIVSAHRTPEHMVTFAQSAVERGYSVIIAGAGGAAHLPGMIASLTTLPVIGVPVALKSLDGLDSLLSIAQMPRGVPVACMAIDNAFNAGLLAARILAIESPPLRKKIQRFQDQQRKKILKANRSLKKS